MIPVNIPNLADPVLYEVLRRICLMAVQYSDIIKAGALADRPTTGQRIFYYCTDTKQWYAYCNDVTIGDQGWVIIG